MAELQSVTGGCHCGAVRYEAKVDLSKLVDCNCSHCEKKGFLLSFTDKQNFKLVAGQDALSEYRFNKKRIAHFFCSVCGVQAFARDGDPAGGGVMINARCVDGIDLSAPERMRFDGRSL